MHHLPYKNLIGIAVGSIMEHAPPLQILLYATASGWHTMAATAKDRDAHTFGAVRRLAKLYAPVLKHVWRNDAMPGWFYLQLDEKHPPKALCGWNLPVTVYGFWEEDPIEASGLVGCAISLHDVDKPVPATSGPAPWFGQGKADDD